MKNATKHADNIKSLYKKLLKEGKPDDKVALNPIRALVVGALSADVSDSRVVDAMVVIDRDFVDLNELRVATELEIIALLGPKYPAIEDRVLQIREILNYIFEKEHTLSLDRVATLGKKETRVFLKELPEMTPFVEGYTLLYGFDSGAIPVDKLIVDLLKENDCLEENTVLADAQRFLESHLKAEDYYPFYALIRKAALLKKKSK